MYYVIERSDLQDRKCLVIDFKAMKETPWSFSIKTALQNGFIDTTTATSIEARIGVLSCVAYGPFTSLPTLQSHPELFI